MKRRAAMAIGCVLAGIWLTARPASAARRPARPDPSGVIWVRPERVPVARRAALDRVLAAAAAGQPLRGVWVRDSRPRIDGRWIAELRDKSTKVTKR